MNSSNIHCVRIGTGPKVVFLHGFMGSGTDWMPVADALKDKFECLLIDLPGHGLTPAPPHHITANIVWMGEQVREFLVAQNIQHFHLVGYSMGARIALLLALNHSKHILSLTIESSEPGLQGEQIRADRVQLDIQRAESIRTHGLDAFLDQWYAAPLFKSLLQHPDFPSVLARRRLGNPDAFAKIIQDVSAGQQADLWPRVSELLMPALWITGELDTKYTPIITRAASLAQHSTLTIIADAGHNAHLEQPVMFAQTLKLFLLSV